MSDPTYLITRLQAPQTQMEFWGKLKQHERCRWIGSLFYAIPITATDLSKRMQSLKKDCTIGFIPVETYIPLRWQIATTPVPLDQDLIDQFYEAYTAIRRQQELQGVVCIRRGEIQEKANLPTDLFNQLFQHLKELRLISTYPSSRDGSEIVSWNS